MRTALSLALAAACAACAAGVPARAPTPGATADAAEPSSIVLGQSDPTRPHCFLSPEGDRVCPVMGQAIVYDEEAQAQMAAQAPPEMPASRVAEDDNDARGYAAEPGN